MLQSSSSLTSSQMLPWLNCLSDDVNKIWTQCFLSFLCPNHLNPMMNLTFRHRESERVQLQRIAVPVKRTNYSLMSSFKVYAFTSLSPLPQCKTLFHSHSHCSCLSKSLRNPCNLVHFYLSKFHNFVFLLLSLLKCFCLHCWLSPSCRRFPNLCSLSTFRISRPHGVFRVPQALWCPGTASDQKARPPLHCHRWEEGECLAGLAWCFGVLLSVAGQWLLIWWKQLSFQPLWDSIH